MINLDWINPLEAAFAGLRHGPLHRFTFESDSGWLFYQVEVLLRKYHIPAYGREIVSDGSTGSPPEQGFSVRPAQAVWAEYILTSAGVPLTCPLLDPRNDLPSGATRPLPRPWTAGSGPTTLIGHIMDAMDGALPGKRVNK